MKKSRVCIMIAEKYVGKAKKRQMPLSAYIEECLEIREGLSKQINSVKKLIEKNLPLLGTNKIKENER